MFGKFDIKKARALAAFAALMSAGLFGEADAANLMVTIPSNYGSSVLGLITGSRVTSAVDSTPQTARTKLNGDPGVFNINLDGQSKIFLRQYTYSTTTLKANEILDAEGDFSTANADASGILESTANAHAAAGYGDRVYVAGYDLGNISIGTISGSALTESGTVKLLDDITHKTEDESASSYTSDTAVHGEGITVRGQDLFVQASINVSGGYDNYDDGYLLHYTINDDGTLSYKDHARIGKNTDQSRINLYNDHIFVSAIGGYQNFGYGNDDTCISVTSLEDGAITNSKRQDINVPDNVKETGQDFRDLKILANGTAYVMTYNLGDSGGIDTTVYQTTVSNLYAETPNDWTVVTSGTYDGWFGKLNAELYTHRLWIEAGQNLLVYTDGATSPTGTWAAKDFAGSKYYQYNFMAMLQPDTVYGTGASLVAVKEEGLTTPSVQVGTSINLDAAWNDDPLCTDQITGTDADESSYYGSVTNDYSEYFLNKKDVTIEAGSTYKTGDLTTNVLAVIDAHAENDLYVDSGEYSLQLQARHTVGSPAGIYAGSGKNVTVSAGNLNIITKGMTGGNSLTNAIWLDAPAVGSSNITITAPATNICMTGGNGGNGIAIQKTDRWGEASDAASASSKITINGDVNIKGLTSAEWGIPLNSENVYSRFNNAGILTSVNNSEVEVTGNVDLDVYGNGITVNAEGSKVSVGGASITVPAGMSYGYYALGAYQGTINVNTGTDGETAGTQDVALDGDIFALSGAQIHLALTTGDSYFHGIADNGGTVDLWLQNGATWTNEARNTRYSEDNEDVGSDGASHITNFYGGATSASAGIIDQKSDKAITIDKYSGYTTVNYATLTNTGDGVTISAAASDSAITVSGDRGSLGETEALETLAGKLTYTAYAEGERNLTGTVKVNEGLTSRSVSRTGTISFDTKTGTGSLATVSSAARRMALRSAAPSLSALTADDEGDVSVQDEGAGAPVVVIGDRETGMMRAAKSAMTTSMLTWRSGMTDRMQRMGDLRMGEGSGIWARTYGGKAKYDKGTADLSQSFWGVQIGADRKLASGWHIGAAFDYNDGDASYDHGGKGDPKAYIGSLYGTKTFADGQYIDIVGKFGNTQNDYTIYNAAGKRFDGKYSAAGYGLSLEYGKRFGSEKGYLEPQVQLSYAKLGSDDYSGTSTFAGNERMYIHQDGFESFVGRLGIAAGKTTAKSDIWLKASVLHEFCGDTTTTYTSDTNPDPVSVAQDFGDTWAELSIGGNWKLGDRALFYADITRSFGGDYEVQWKLNAGLRYAF